MEEAMKEQIDELSRCRADYSALFKNFKQARVIYEEKDQLTSAQLQLVRTKNEAFEKKLEAQKRAIISHKQARKGFENDVNQLKFATELLEARERCIHDKHEGVAAENFQMKLDAKSQAEVVSGLHAVIEKLNQRITNETVPKVALERLSSEIDTMKRIMKEEMVTLETHQNVNKRYVDLQCKVDNEMISLDRYKASAANIDALKRKLEGSVPRQEFALLLDKYQKSTSEKLKIEKSMEQLTAEKEEALQISSEFQSKFLALQSHLLQIEREFTATRLSKDVLIKDVQQLNFDLEKVGDEKKQLKYKNKILETTSVDLANQLENLKHLLNKESHSVKRLEHTIETMSANFEKERTSFQKQTEIDKKERAKQLLNVDLNIELNVAAEKSRSLKSLETITALHSEEINGYKERLHQQVLASVTDLESMRHSIESMCMSQIEGMKENEKKRIQELTNVHHNHEISIMTSHTNDIEALKAGHQRELDAVIMDRQQYLENALHTLQLKHTEELSFYMAHHSAVLENVKEEVRDGQVARRELENYLNTERTRATVAESSLKDCQSLLAKLTANFENEKKNDVRGGNREVTSSSGSNLIGNESFASDRGCIRETTGHGEYMNKLFEGVGEGISRSGQDNVSQKSIHEETESGAIEEKEGSKCFEGFKEKMKQKESGLEGALSVKNDGHHSTFLSADQILSQSLQRPLPSLLSNNAVAAPSPSALLSDGITESQSDQSAYVTYGGGSVPTPETHHSALVQQLRLPAYMNGHTIPLPTLPLPLPHAHAHADYQNNALVDLMSTRRSISNDGSARRGSHCQAGSSSSFAESLDFSPPHFSTSPLVTPYQSMNQVPNPVRRHSDSSTYNSNIDFYAGDNQMSGLTYTAPHTVTSPAVSSREQLLERLISLTKDSNVKTSAVPTTTPPL
jgi:hypothetical protein